MDLVRITARTRLTAAFAAIHTVHFQRYLTVKNIHLVNTSGATVAVHLTLTASGSSPVEADSLLWGFALPSNDFIEFGEGLIIAPSYSIYAVAASADAIVMTLSGTEE